MTLLDEVLAQADVDRAQPGLRRIERHRKRLNELRTPTVAPAPALDSPREGMLLHHLVTAWDAHRVLEVGTRRGVSGAYIAAALEPRDGWLRSLEESTALADIATWFWDICHVRAEIRRGPIADTLAKALVPAPQVVVVNHGHGQHVEQIAAACRPGALLILADTPAGLTTTAQVGTIGLMVTT